MREELGGDPGAEGGSDEPKNSADDADEEADEPASVGTAANRACAMPWPPSRSHVSLLVPPVFRDSASAATATTVPYAASANVPGIRGLLLLLKLLALRSMAHTIAAALPVLPRAGLTCAPVGGWC